MELLIQTDATRTISNKAGNYEYKIEQAGKMVTITRKLTFNTTTITPDIYADFRTLMVAWNDEVTRSVLLRKK